MSAPFLFDSPGNPAPPGAHLAMLTTADGVLLRAASWRPETRHPRGTVLVLQGRAEFIEKYFEVVGELVGRGFAVVCFDWRGQGASGRALAEHRKGHVRHFDDFRLDVEAIEASLLRALPGPVFCLAHSMGSCVALAAAAEGWLPAERLVASTPMIELSIVRNPRLAGVLARLLHGLGLGDRFVPGGRPHSISTEPFDGNRLSRDPSRYARNAAVAAELGAGAIGAPTIGWLNAAYEAMGRLRRADFAARIRVPTLVIGAGDDPVCSTAATESFARLLPPGSYLLIPGSRHEVMMEQDTVRGAFWRAFDAFVPGTPDPGEDAGSAAEAVEDGLVEAPIA